MSGLIWYLTGTVVLAAALFFPMRNIIWVLSVRRLETKTKTTLDEPERAAQRQRAGFIAALVGLGFSAFFNFVFFGIPKAGAVIVDLSQTLSQTVP